MPLGLLIITSRRRLLTARSQRANPAERIIIVRVCIHFTAAYTTGWVNYANETSQADAQQGGYVDSRRCSAFDQNLEKNSSLCVYLFIYLLSSVAYDREG